MVLAVAFEDAKTKQTRSERTATPGVGGEVKIPYLGSRDNPASPSACLVLSDPCRSSTPHFHAQDQFQIVVGGGGSLGRHELMPNCVHFSRAFTPYGPLVSDESTGMSFFLLRPHFDFGPQRLPKELSRLKRVSNRRPWQTTCPFSFPVLDADDAQWNAIAGLKDENGLAGYTLSMKPNACGPAPDPASGGGQFLIVFKGSHLHAGQVLQASSLAFMYPEDGPYEIVSGAAGLEMLVLSFPHRGSRGVEDGYIGESTSVQS